MVAIFGAALCRQKQVPFSSGVQQLKLVYRLRVTAPLQAAVIRRDYTEWAKTVTRDTPNIGKKLLQCCSQDGKYICRLH